MLSASPDPPGSAVDEPHCGPRRWNEPEAALKPVATADSRAGLHAWTEDDVPNIARWGIASFSPNDLHATTRLLLDWLAATRCSKVAIHFDVDTIDSNELVLGHGASRPA